MTAHTRPKIGDDAPDFTLSGWPDGEPVQLAQARGRPVVLYFYPRDMTPGCTAEACDFRDATDSFAAHNALVLGISPDPVDTHRKFAEKYGLAFSLLSDPAQTVCKRYGTWVEKLNYGKKYWGVQRATFLIDEDGKIAGCWPRVKVAGHVATVLAKLSDLDAK